MSDTPKVLTDADLKEIERRHSNGSRHATGLQPTVCDACRLLESNKEARAERDRLQCQVIEMQKRLGVERTDYEMALEDLRHRIVNTAKELRAHLGKEAKDDRA